VFDTDSYDRARQIPTEDAVQFAMRLQEFANLDDECVVARLLDLVRGQQRCRPQLAYARVDLYGFTHPVRSAYGAETQIRQAEAPIARAKCELFARGYAPETVAGLVDVARGDDVTDPVLAEWAEECLARAPKTAPRPRRRGRPMGGGRVVVNRCWTPKARLQASA
jgi:hypothetical protein